jgi:hypothetical protein
MNKEKKRKLYVIFNDDKFLRRVNRTKEKISFLFSSNRSYLFSNYGVWTILFVLGYTYFYHLEKEPCTHHRKACSQTQKRMNQKIAFTYFLFLEKEKVHWLKNYLSYIYYFQGTRNRKSSFISRRKSSRSSNKREWSTSTWRRITRSKYSRKLSFISFLELTKTNLLI